MLNAVQSRTAVSWDVRQLTSCVSRAQDIVETVRVHVGMLLDDLHSLFNILTIFDCKYKQISIAI